MATVNGFSTIDLLSIHTFLSRKYHEPSTTGASVSTTTRTEEPRDTPPPHFPLPDGDAAEVSTHFYFYLIRALPLLEKYKEIKRSYQKIQFVGTRASQNDQVSSGLEEVVREFLKVVSDYFPDETALPNWQAFQQTADGDGSSGTGHFHRSMTGMPVSTTATSKSRQWGGGRIASSRRLRCSVCQNETDASFSIYDNHYVCETCGLVTETTQHHISYKDIDRVNISSKYTYDRRTHFRDCINQFQGKQNASIDPKVYEDLCTQFVAHGLIPTNYKELPNEVAFESITKEHIMLFLKDTKHTKHYEDTVLIHTTLTHRSPPDISHLENQLIQDFDTLTDIYDKTYKHTNDRKNFINTQYVLYQLLRRHKFPCKKEDFNILKTIDRKYFHDTICAELFQQLGWNLHPLF